jgi:hypothetical protein
MVMIVHPKIKSIASYVEGQLSDPQAKNITAHLNRCQRCRERANILKKMKPALTLNRNLSLDFTDRVLSHLPEMKRVTQPTCGEVKAIRGSLMICRNGVDEALEAFPKMGILEGDTLRVVGNSLALIDLNDGSTLYLNKETEIQFFKRNYPLSLHVGELLAMMKPQRKPFEIWTPAAVLGVIGTDFDAKVTEKKSTLLQVLKGKVSFKNESGSTIVKKKRQVEAAKDAKPIPEKIKDTRTIYNWTAPMKPKRTERGWIMKKLYLLIAAILAFGVLIGGYSFYQGYFAYELPPSYESSERLDSSASPGESFSKTKALELTSPYTQEGSSWRVHVRGQVQKENAWIDLYQMVSRSDIIDVDEKNGSRVLVTIEDVKVPEGPEKEIADRMIGRRFAYSVSPDGRSHSFSTADGRPIEYMEIEFYGRMLQVSNISGIFLKKQPLIPGDQWIEEYEDKVPGYPNSHIRTTDRYQFVKYEFRDGVEYAIIQAHSRGSVGGFPWAKVVEPKVTQYVQLDRVKIDHTSEYCIDVESGRVVSGMFTSMSSAIKGTITSVITGRRVPVTEVVEQESGDTARTFFTVEYLQ